MVAPEVVEARVTMLAPFCAAVVEIRGAAAGWVATGMVPPLPPQLERNAPKRRARGRCNCKELSMVLS